LELKLTSTIKSRGLLGGLWLLGGMAVVGCGSDSAFNAPAEASNAGSSSTSDAGAKSNAGAPADGGSGVGGSGNATAGTSSSSGGRAASGGSATGGSAAGGSAGAAATGGCGQQTKGATRACTKYAPSTIEAMRTAQTSGCFELGGVGLIARTDSPSEPRLYVQDEGGADFSAILAKCAASASHACSTSVRAKIPQLYDTMDEGAQLTLQGYYLNGGVTGFEQFYIEDIIDDCKKLARPAPIDIAVSDIGRDARLPAKWFQRANVTIPKADPLVMYDYSPADLNLSAPSCPDFAGFAMVPKSQATSEPDACNGKTNPAARALDPKEVLIGRHFFNQFLFGADCACVQGTGEILVQPTSSVSGTVRGYLILEVDKGSTNPYQVFEPAADQTFPLK
jgi:hypothetical protein